MKRKFLESIGIAAIAILVMVMFAQIPVPAQDAQDKLWSGNGARSIEGAWDVTVTLRNCLDGAEIRSFPRLNTFMQGGTMQETAAAGTAAQPALRSPGHGVWAHIAGQSFTYTIKFLRLNADGSPAGFVRENRAVEVDAFESSYSATGTASINLPNGTVLGPFCATEAGTRIK